MTPKYAYVAVDIPHLPHDLAFEVNGLPVGAGDVLAVPIRNRFEAGIVTSVSDKLEEPVHLKKIAAVIEKNAVSAQQISLAREIASYYCCSLFECLKLFLSPGLSLKLVKNKEGFKLLRPKTKAKTAVYIQLNNLPDKATEKQNKVIACLKQNLNLTKKELIKESGVSASVVNGLIKKEVISQKELPIERMPEAYREVYNRPKLNEPQQKAFEGIKKAVDKNKQMTFLLFGVAASGKTEIYLRSIEECLKKGKSAIYLLPEISLTPQVNSRLLNRFGDEVSILHSNMSVGERFDQYQAVKQGRHRIVVGARSALFAPMENLGLIVIDEEQEATYKQNRSPRYDARKVALLRANQEDSVVIFGSATPSIETLYSAQNGSYKLLNLAKRAVGRTAKMSLVDLSKEPNANSSISRYLKRKINELEGNEKAVVFLNRRGFSGFLICRKCGHVPKCPNCDVSLTLHGKHLVCHYCNRVRTFSSKCKCGSPLNKFLAAGTQRVEWELNLFFPKLPVIRMDADTTSQKGSHGRHLSIFKSHEKAVLLGTQMVAKGLDYPNVKLVGAVNIDVGLNMPDFRSAERVFQLISQVCGRAGRSQLMGEVVLQTYDPQNKTINSVLNQNYLDFHQRELKRREELNYPPFAKLINVGLKGKDREKVRSAAKELAIRIRNLNLKGLKNILGPSAAPIAYINRNHRWHILLKTKNDFGQQERAIFCKTVNSYSKKDVTIVIDVDPTSML